MVACEMERVLSLCVEWRHNIDLEGFSCHLSGYCTHALKETSNLYAEKNTSNKQQRSIIELIETVEKWCKETGRGLTG